MILLNKFCGDVCCGIYNDLKHIFVLPIIIFLSIVCSKRNYVK